MPSVLQPWVQDLRLMQQSVLISSVRGPDGLPKYNAAKYLLRWLRRCVLISAFDKVALTSPIDPRGGSFTGPSVKVPFFPVDNWEEFMEPMINAYFTEFDLMPGHFTKHFMSATEILGYKHPDARIREWWAKLYIRLVKDLHLNPENEAELDARLGDDESVWFNGSEKATAY